MKKTRELPNYLMSNIELAQRHRLSTILKISPDLSAVKVEIPFKGKTFTVATAILTIARNGKEPKTIEGEGVTKRSHSDPLFREYTASNLARERALEAIDKKLRRPTGIVGHRYEG